MNDHKRNGGPLRKWIYLKRKLLTRDFRILFYKLQSRIVALALSNHQKAGPNRAAAKVKDSSHLEILSEFSLDLLFCLRLFLIEKYAAKLAADMLC